MTLIHVKERLIRLGIGTGRFDSFKQPTYINYVFELLGQLEKFEVKGTIRDSDKINRNLKTLVTHLVNSTLRPLKEITKGNIRKRKCMLKLKGAFLRADYKEVNSRYCEMRKEL